MYNPEKAHQAQEAWCAEHHTPHFAPNKYNDYKCYRCKQNIYAEKGHPVAERLPRGRVRLDYTADRPGIDVERAGSGLICGCPFCFASFDD